MIPEITEHQTFTKITADAIVGQKRTFENCKFIGSDLSFADLSGVIFARCKESRLFLVLAS